MAALTALTLTFAALWATHARLEHWVRHGREVSRLARESTASAADRQADLLGYMIGGSPAFLAGESDARGVIALKLDSLMALTREDPGQHRHAQRLRHSIEAWDAGFAESVLRGSASADARRAVHMDAQLFDRVRSEARALVSRSERSYRQREARATAFSRAMILIVLVALLVLAWVLETKRRGVRALTDELLEQQASLEDQAAELEQQVEELSVLTDELEGTNDQLQREAEFRAQAEAGRSEAHALLDFVIATAPVAVALHDAEGRFQIVNQAYSDLSGLRPMEHVGRQIQELPVQSVSSLGPAVRHALGRGTPQMNLELQTNGGPASTARMWLASVYPIFSATGELRGAGSIAIETTERRRLEQQLLQSQKMEAVGRLAGGVAHDFNNLLTVILSYASIVRLQVGEQHPVTADLVAIEDAGRRAAALTSQLLAFSRKQVLQPQLIDLNEVVESMDRMLRRLIGEDVELVLKLAPSLHPVFADRGQLEQVLMNLIINARDAMPAGGRISIETSEQDLADEHLGRRIGVRPGRYLLLAVSDSGVGMTPEVLGQVFEPFFTTKPAGEGTGLGLSTVYGIVKQSGGDLWVYSEPGVGTTFKLFFPVAAPGAAARRSPLPHRGQVTGHETVLIVEDDATLRPLTTRILRGAGFHVLTASNGLEGLAIARNYDGVIDLVATDVVMPHVNGRVLAEELATARPGIKVLFMSGYTDDDLMRRGVVQDGSSFLQKPFTPAELTAKVRDMLDA